MRHALFLLATLAAAQPYGIDQKDFPATEFQERRAKVFDAGRRSSHAPRTQLPIKDPGLRGIRRPRPNERADDLV